MLFLGLLAVCCGLGYRLMQRFRSDTETPHVEVGSTFMRCPACACPLERSTSPSTATAKCMPSKPAITKSSLGLAQADDNISNRSSQTVKFREDVSEVSKSANAV
jgi:hypothetical protein